ncbi:hypothetical protein ARMSODRAFT_844102, partial [Armillaria solidipes]
HAQLCNVIEHIFGVIKRQWKIICEVNEYPLHIQSLIPLAIAILHNFVSIYQPPNPTLLRIPSARELLVPDCLGDTVPTVGVSNEETEHASAHQDTIAKEMLQDYQEELQ